MFSKAFNAPLSRSISSGNADPERPSSDKKKVIPRGPYSDRILGTLNLSKLSHTDFLDVSNKSARNIWFKHSPRATMIRSRVGFPGNTQGFFYYHVPPPHLPPAMGQLRFRITPNNDPSTFNSGSDLLTSGPVPWGLSLFHLAGSEKYEDLCAQLVAEGLISRELLERCRLIWRNTVAGSPFTSRGECYTT
ncbi:hypothetical protein F5887DRAFT_1079293 [Amanita rubescens]|nr:hypothetical protein F5887DRAFT_1079293 [Amanita rubescens]